MNDWWDPFFIAIVGVIFFLAVLWIYVAYMLPLSVEAGISIGATEATKLELLKSIANWLFENQNYTVFRLPQITVQQRSEQRLQVNYAL